MSTYTLIESRTRNLPLSAAQAAELERLGRELASDTPYWADESPRERCVVDCRPGKRGGYDIRVDNAVGVIGALGTTLVIRPKIPKDHFLFLMSYSRGLQSLPRMDQARAWALEDPSMWHLVARWYIRALEEAIERDLPKDYCEFTDSGPVMRGRVALAESAVNWYCRGSAASTCTLEEFSVDTPLNRVLRAAAIAVVGSRALDSSLRRRAMSAIDRMGEVGDFTFQDLQSANIDRHSDHCREALILAAEVLRDAGRFPAHGNSVSWSYLMRTPLAIQDGLRALLHERLSSDARPSAAGGSRRIRGANMRVHPDLVFPAASAIGDVKYKRDGAEWLREDLYEVVSFATAYSCGKAVVIGFDRQMAPGLPTVGFGDVTVAHASWNVRRGTTPQQSADALCRDVEHFMAAAWPPPLADSTG